MTREEYFLKYNNDNIITNLLQAEDHLRNLSETDNEQGHNACIVKHLLIAEGECSEAISHSKNPSIYHKIKSGCNELRTNLLSIKVQKAIEEIRNVRKKAELLDPEYNISECKACEKMRSALTKSLNSSMSLEKDRKIINSNQRGVTMGKLDLKQIGMINGGQAVGYLLRYGVDYIDAKWPAASPLTSKGLWAAVIVGAGGQLLADRFIKNDALKLAACVGLSHVLVSKVGDIVKGYVVPPPVARGRLPIGAPARGRLPMGVPAARARIIPTPAGLPGAAPALVTVD